MLPARLIFLCALLASLTAAAQAQEYQVERSPGALSMGSSLGAGSAFPVVEHAPYRADVLTRFIDRNPDGTVTLREAYNVHARDSQGRLFDEQLATRPEARGSWTEHSVKVFDPTAMKETQWGGGLTKIYRSSDIPASLSTLSSRALTFCEAPEQSSCGLRDQLTFQKLGVREIGGVEAQGCRSTRIVANTGTARPGVIVTDSWVSPELQITVLSDEHEANGSERVVQLSDIRRVEPDPALFHPPADYTDGRVAPRTAPENNNPNAAAIREYGRIEWHGATARLVAAGSRPLTMAALTLSTCMDLAVNSEDPTYEFHGDVLDVTAPQSLVRSPEKHVYAGKPALVDVTFAVGPDGLPKSTGELLEQAARQVNQKQPFAFRVTRQEQAARTFYTFEPTRTRDGAGVLIAKSSPMDEAILLPRSEKAIYLLAEDVSSILSRQTGLHFSCCQVLIAGQIWGSKSMVYEADNVPAREVIENLITENGYDESYTESCEPFDKRFCFINVHPDWNHARPPSGVCTAQGYDGD